MDDGHGLTLGSCGGVNGGVAKQAIVQSFLGLRKIIVNVKINHNVLESKVS